MSTLPQIASEPTMMNPAPKFPVAAAAANPATAAVSSVDPESAWQQVLARNRGASFFYGVATTGVFCRPGCASRLPLRRNVRFFATADAARAAGFRACARCKPQLPSPRDTVSRVRAHIEAHHDRPIRLQELGRIAGLSPFTVQRLFKREMGASPLQYQRALRAGRMRAALKKGAAVTDAIYAAGFGSSSRAYEGSQLGMAPARFAQGGRGERIGFASARTPFGWMIVGGTERGLCWLSLASSKAEAVAALREEFPEAARKRDPSLARWVDAAIASVREGNDLVRNQTGTKFAAAPHVPQSRIEHLDLRGTVFQLRVWQALRQIPRGQTRSYSQLARELGDPKATRAVAHACAMNRVAVLVPCHRVVGADGSLTGYRWGRERKRALLDAERG